MEANQGGTSSLQYLVVSEMLAMASAQTETVVLPSVGAVSPPLIVPTEEHAVVEMLVMVCVRTVLFAALLMAGVALVSSIVGPRSLVATPPRIRLHLLHRLGRVAVDPAGTVSVQMVFVALNMDGAVLARPTVLVPMTLQPLSKKNHQPLLLLIHPRQMEPAIHPHPLRTTLELAVEVLAGTVCVLMELVALNTDGAAHPPPIVMVISHHLAAMATQAIPPQTQTSMSLRRL